MRAAYGFDTLLAQNPAANGAGQTIAIIDAFDNPKFVSSSSTSYGSSDLYKFNQQFGLPQFGTPGGPTFTKVNQSGGTSYPRGNRGWGDEIALDVEWAHALAPAANIILVEATDNSFANLITGAVDWARNRAGVSVISMSFAGSEFSTESSYDTYFTTPAGHTGVSFVASTGDDGAPGGYPAYSPNVVAVGGTTLTLNNGNYSGESTWNNSIGSTGGGISQYEPKPTYQASVTLSASFRTTPDIAFDADPNTGVPIYDSYSQGSTFPWVQIGGTSLSAPSWAALLAVANQGRALAGLGTLDAATTTLPALYALPSSDFHDITTGNNNGFSAGPGYDLTTGLGTPLANRVAADLSGPAPSIPDMTAASDSGISSSDNLTRVQLPTFSGTAPAQSTVQILSDGVVVGSGTATGGNYNITITTPLADGPHNISARVGFDQSGALPIMIDTVGPTLVNQVFNYDTPVQNLSFSFNESIAGSVQNTDLTLTNSYGTSTTIPSANIVLMNPDNQTAQFTFINYPYNALPDGIYQATIPASAVTDGAGNPLSSNIVLNFFFLNGDFNHDGSVDIQDLKILSTNWGASPRTFSQGDATYNGSIDIADLHVVAVNWLKDLFA